MRAEILMAVKNNEEINKIDFDENFQESAEGRMAITLENWYDYYQTRANNKRKED